MENGAASDDLFTDATERGGGMILVGLGSANVIWKWKKHLDAQRMKAEPAVPAQPESSKNTPR